MPGLRALWLVLCLMAVAAAPARAEDISSLFDAGATHTCTTVPVLQCWGEGAQGQLGDGTRTASAVPVRVSGVSHPLGVAAGTDHACTVESLRGVLCWGFATHVYLGEGQVTPAPVRGTSEALWVTAGAEHDCALTRARAVMCWGAGRHGELGNGATADSAVAVPVRLDAPALQIAAGPGYTCAVLTNGTVQCWGRGSNGELGNGARADSATPVTVSGITNAIMISVGSSHACVWLTSGGAACWGSNRSGQLGDGGYADSTTPVAVSGLSEVAGIAAGGSHTCARLLSRSVACWGRGGDGELGDGLRRDSPTPVLVSGLNDAFSVSAGLAHTCARREVGVVCWGAGDRGQLGDGRMVSSPVPVQVLLSSDRPRLGKSTTLQPVSGTVRVKPPGGSFTTLGAAATLPLGTTVDATRGTLRLTAAADGAGRTQSGVFRDGEFTTGQQASGLTVLKLTRISGCAAGAAQAKPKKKKRKRNSLWGDAQGNFQTAGRHGSATVRGTTWLLEDTCKGTSVRVTTGSVRVFDFKTRKTTIVSAGGSIVVGGSSRSTVRGFVTEVERVLTGLASGRKRLATALGGALQCSVSPAAAVRDVRDVIDNRTSMRAEARGLAAPNARAKQVRAHLVAAITHSLAADRHYRDWLTGVEGARCPLPRNAAFAAAGREDVKATRAKRQLVAAFNPLARRQHKRTWRAGQL